MTNDRVVIAGGGIGGLTLALTLHQIGVPCVVVEASSEMRPLGVGINVQPNAVRELLETGIDLSDLDSIGVPALEWALVGLNGKEVYAEPRGLEAGYKWPQYAAHRGQRVHAERLGCVVVELNVQPDHVHLLVKVPPKVSISHGRRKTDRTETGLSGTDCAA